ncbi:MAG: heme-copper oxidase subunit III [Verrucomicrobiota bacterium]
METAIHHDEAVIYKRASKFAMIIFLASEFMLFAALFATYIILRTPDTLPFVAVIAIFFVGAMVILQKNNTLFTCLMTAGCVGAAVYILNHFVTLTPAWLGEEEALEFSKMLPTIIVNSFVLIASSFTYHAAEANVEKGKSPVLWLLGTIALGSYFLLGQIKEWAHMKHEGMWFDTGNQFTSNFFATTGFHGFHVLVGIILIAYVTVKALLGHYNKENHISLQNIGFYWHFVDAIWLVVFSLYYGEHLHHLLK